jgi:hypothetical protein
MFGKPFAHEKTRGTPWKMPQSGRKQSVNVLSHKHDHIVIARRCTMKTTRIAIATICLLWAAVATALTSEATTTFAGAIVGIDQAQRTITFQTMDGQTWALAVGDPNILKQEQVAKGDRVRIEIDLSGRITKITKILDQLLPEPTQSLDEVRP